MKLFLSILLLTILAAPGWAYPEFQRYSRDVSGRSVNCSMCHLHPDGPEGLKPGQIGSLDQDQLNELGLARQAFKPGNNAKSPILNEFGNHLLNDIGKEKLLIIKQRPEMLEQNISQTSDLDGDGILDAQEFMDGTHPLNVFDGHPWKLFKINLQRNWFHLTMIVIATALGLYGLQNLLYWFSLRMRKEKE